MQSDEVVRLKLSSVKERLLKVDVPWVVFAGAAAYCYGSRRKVTDIDILVRSVDLKKAKAVLEGIQGMDVAADLKIKTNHGTCHFFYG